MSSFIAAGTATHTRGVPMVPFYIFYSMFGFQRVGDLIWLAADARARGFLLGATAGRTTLLGEGLQHQDGHSLLLASDGAHLPGLRPRVRVRAGDDREARHPPHVRSRSPRTSSTISRSTTRTTRCRRCPTGSRTASLRGLYQWADAPEGPAGRATAFSGSAQGASAAPPLRARRAVGCRRRALEGDVVQAAPRGSARHRTVEPAAPVAAGAHRLS